MREYQRESTYLHFFNYLSYLIPFFTIQDYIMIKTRILSIKYSYSVMNIKSIKSVLIK